MDDDGRRSRRADAPRAPARGIALTARRLKSRTVVVVAAWGLALVTAAGLLFGEMTPSQITPSMIWAGAAASLILATLAAGAAWIVMAIASELTDEARSASAARSASEASGARAKAGGEFTRDLTRVGRFWREGVSVFGAAVLAFGFAGSRDDDVRPIVMAIGAAALAAGLLALRSAKR